jgi:hypothetical protein
MINQIDSHFLNAFRPDQVRGFDVTRIVSGLYRNAVQTTVRNHRPPSPYKLASAASSSAKSGNTLLSRVI